MPKWVYTKPSTGFTLHGINAWVDKTAEIINPCEMSEPPKLHKNTTLTTSQFMLITFNHNRLESLTVHM